MSELNQNDAESLEMLVKSAIEVTGNMAVAEIMKNIDRHTGVLKEENNKLKLQLSDSIGKNEILMSELEQKRTEIFDLHQKTKEYELRLVAFKKFIDVIRPEITDIDRLFTFKAEESVKENVVEKVADEADFSSVAIEDAVFTPA